MSTAIYSFNDVENQKASPAIINDAIAEVLRNDGGACYEAMEPYLLAPGKNGSRSFDQAECVFILLAYDAKGEGRVADILEDKPALSKRHLWSHLVAVLKKTGFKIERGRLAGLLTHTPEPEAEQAEAA